MIIDCTKEKPWNHTSDPGDKIRHTDGKEIGEQQDGYPGGDIITLKCPHCGHIWKQELPQ